MPRKNLVPILRRHKPSSQGMVRLSGQDFYLGRWPAGLKEPPAAVQAEYQRVVAEWIGNGRQLLRPEPEAAGPSVAEVCLAYLRHCETYYRKPTGEPTSELANVKAAIRRLRTSCGHKPAAAFDGIDLETIRGQMIEGGIVRTQINKTVGRLKRVFKWAGARNLVPPAVLQKLQAVEGLRAGRTHAVEGARVLPVPVAFVEAALPFMRPQIAAMVELQRLSGMRPGEACAMRTIDLDTSGEIWLYRPSEHKTQHHGKTRVIALGPQAQAVLRPWLRLNVTEFLFQPAESVAAFRAAQRAARKSKVQPSQAKRKKRRPKKVPGDRYGQTAYGHAVYRAIDLANRARLCDACKEAKRIPKTACDDCKAGLIPRWHPNQLRHLRATEVRRQYGLEGAQVAMGHAHAKVSEIYAERDQALAERIAGEIG